MTVAAHNCTCTDTAGVVYPTLETLRGRLMRRLGFGNQLANPPPGMTEIVDSFLHDAQVLIDSRLNSPQRTRFFSWDLVAGQNLYDVADNVEQATCTKVLNVGALEWVGIVRPGNLWVPLREGIPPVANSYDASSGYPVRYEIRQCIEVWPAPADTEGQLVIKGTFHLLPFTADADVATVNPDALFMLALALGKKHYRQPDANDYATLAESLIIAQVAGSHGTRRYVPGRGRDPEVYYVEPVPTVPFT
jgi:hypothetical protein